MFSFVIHCELITLLLFVIFSFVAAAKASKLVYSQTEHQLYHKARKLLYWSIGLSLLIAGMATADLVLAAITHPLFWTNRLLIHAPLSAIPILLIWFGSYPRLRRLMQRTKGQTTIAPDVARRRHASDPAFIVPYQIAPLFSLALLCIAIFPPNSFRWSTMMISITFILFVACLLWMFQTYRNQLAAEASISYRPWLRSLRHASVLLVVIAVLSIPFISTLESNRLSARMNITIKQMSHSIR